MNDINKLLIRRKKYLRFACGEEAGKSLFGEKQYTIIENGIDFDKYKFNEIYRKNIRNKYNVKENDILIGHVGNFSEIKNYNYLIELFYFLRKINKNYKLLLIGDDTKGKIYKEKKKSKIKQLFCNLERYNRGVKLDNNYSIDKASEKLYEYYKNKFRRQ